MKRIALTLMASIGCGSLAVACPSGHGCTMGVVMASISFGSVFVVGAIVLAVVGIVLKLRQGLQSISGGVNASDPKSSAASAEETKAEILRKIAQRMNRSRPEVKDGELAFLNAGQDGVVRGLLWKQQARVIVDRLNCRIYLPKGWNSEPEIRALSPFNAEARFAGADVGEWATVECMKLAPDHVNDDPGDWVNAAYALVGRLVLNPHSSRAAGVDDCKYIHFNRLNLRDRQYMNYHQADDMAAFAGTIGVAERLCRLFVVVIRRGRDSWKLTYSFPAADGVTTNSLPFRPTEIEKAIRIFVPFETHGMATCAFCGSTTDEPTPGGEGSVTIDFENYTLFDGLPKVRAGMNMACCQSCRAKAEDRGVARSVVEGLPDVKAQLDKGASVVGVKFGEKPVEIK